MPEWLTPVVQHSPIAPATLAMRLLLALIFGGLVALIYRAAHGRRGSESVSMTTTLVLMSVLIAMTSMVIGESVARAFGLVGALSIVRFRTVVDDTRDTAYVIFAVVVGMATGTGLLFVPLIGVPVVAIAAIGLQRASEGASAANAAPSATATLAVRLGLGREPGTFEGILDRHLRSHRLVSTATARQGAAIDLTYVVELRSDAAQAALVGELNAVEGVQSVDVRRA